MNPDQRQLLTLGQLPARLTAEQVAWYLGFQPHEIPVLISGKLLKPLGHPASSGIKYFSTSQVTRLRDDERWLERASDAIVKFWREKNERRTKKSGHDGLDKHTSSNILN